MHLMNPDAPLTYPEKISTASPKSAVLMQAPWYVYTLTDPRTGSVFYVGKGARSRIDTHEYELRLYVKAWVENGISKTVSRVHGEKFRQICDIWASGEHVQKTIVAMFWDEAAAFECEAAWAALFPGQLLQIDPLGVPARLKRRSRPSAEPSHFVCGYLAERE